MPEVVAAAAELSDAGVIANVIDVTSASRLHRGWRNAIRSGVRGAVADHRARFHLATLFPKAERHAPIVTVHDASSHALSWLGSVFGASVVPLGVDAFGQSGTVADLYEAHDLSTASIVNAALLALSD